MNCSDLSLSYDEDSIRRHLEMFAQIAAENGGNRADGTPGFEASLAYIRAELAGAGYQDAQLITQPFEYPDFELLDGSEFEVTSPEPVSFEYNPDAGNEPTVGDFTDFTYVVSGEVSGPLVAVDLDLGPDNQSSSGCEPEDFADFPAGSIALVQRGTCFFPDKVNNAEAAGATGLVVFNQGNTPERSDLARINLFPNIWDVPLPQRAPSIPTTFTNYAVGEQLATLVEAGETVVRIKNETRFDTFSSQNLIAETASGDPSDVFVVGAHVDSVPAGPGINDNGTGVAVLLEYAKAVAACEPQRRIRFIFWGAEEPGLWGSNHYVNELGEKEWANIAAYFNTDMLGSQNYANLIYDSSFSNWSGSAPGPIPGSIAIEAYLSGAFEMLGVASELTADIVARSDHFQFDAEAALPTGGLFSGAEVLKTAEQARRYGGVADEPYDACYHLECDTIDNVNFEALATMATVAGRAIGHYGIEGAAIEGQRSVAAPPETTQNASAGPRNNAGVFSGPAFDAGGCSQADNGPRK